MGTLGMDRCPERWLETSAPVAGFFIAAIIHWIGLRENLHRKPWFMKKIRDVPKFQFPISNFHESGCIFFKYPISPGNGGTEGGRDGPDWDAKWWSNFLKSNFYIKIFW